MGKIHAANYANNGDVFVNLVILEIKIIRFLRDGIWNEANQNNKWIMEVITSTKISQY